MASVPGTCSFYYDELQENIVNDELIDYKNPSQNGFADLVNDYFSSLDFDV